jgi:RHS repeat-associated protein
MDGPFATMQILGAQALISTIRKNRYCGNLGHQQDDESGLIYMRARYYEPGSGRYVASDSGRNGQNWFIYVANNPVRSVDTTGNYQVNPNEVGSYKFWFGGVVVASLASMFCAAAFNLAGAVFFITMAVFCAAEALNCTTFPKGLNMAINGTATVIMGLVIWAVDQEVLAREALTFVIGAVMTTALVMDYAALLTIDPD